MSTTRDSFAPRQRRRSALPLADLVSGCLTPALAKYGFSAADVLLHWPDIVGEGLAERCHPIKLQWRRGAGVEASGEPATLVVRVEGSFALGLQHRAPVVIERVNTYFGWRCVGKLVLRQGPLPPRLRHAKARSAPGDGNRARAREATDGIGEEGLRAALAGLGAHVLARRREP